MSANSSPLVSVIIPSYNHIQFIEKAINSILTQTYPNIELIIVDDGSTDGSAEFLKRFTSTIKCTCILQSNHGLCRTLNRTIPLCHGKYLVIMASDDLRMPESIAIQVKYLEQYPKAAICCGSIIRINASGEEILPRNQHAKKLSYGFEDIILRNFAIPAPTAMIKKSVIEQVGGYDEDVFVEDFQMWLKITHAGHDVLAIPHYIASYRILEKNREGLMASSKSSIIDKYKNHPFYTKAKVIHSLQEFSVLARSDKGQAMAALKKIIKEGNLWLMFGCRYFYRGMFHLAHGDNFLTRLHLSGR